MRDCVIQRKIFIQGEDVWTPPRCSFSSLALNMAKYGHTAKSQYHLYS